MMDVNMFMSDTSIQQHLKNRIDSYNNYTKTKSFKEKLLGLYVIELNITEMCTRKCFFCPRGDDKTYSNRKLFMSDKTIDSIIKQCIEYNFEGELHFCGFGESLTHPNFFELIKKIKSSISNYIVLTTNGDLFKIKSVSDIYKCGVDHITISCYDGQEEYNNFDDILKKTNKSYNIRKLWKSYNESNEDFVLKNKFNNRAGSVTKISFENNNNKPCYRPFYKLFIDYNGDILLCDNDWMRVHNILKNINTNNLYDIWFCEEFKRIRNDLKKGIRNGPACKNCSVEGTLIGKKSVDILS